jgi:hypothetical protein
MGLMGYVRSGLRQHWHVYGVIRDNSPDAFTPTLGFATRVVSVTVLLFFVLIGGVFWLASLAGKKSHHDDMLTAYTRPPEPDMGDAAAILPPGGGALPVPTHSAEADLA